MKIGVSSFSPPLTAIVGNTFSSGFFHVLTASSRSILTSPYVNAALSVTSPITVYLHPIESSLSAATSATIHPYNGANNLSASTSVEILAPSILPNAILLTASTIPFALRVYALTTALS